MITERAGRWAPLSRVVYSVPRVGQEQGQGGKPSTSADLVVDGDGPCPLTRPVFPLDFWPDGPPSLHLELD
jgi:hypothetical protein